MILFEIYLEPGALGQPILTDETKTDTGAQVMTDSEAASAGFQGLPGNTSGQERRWIACRDTDGARLMNALNISGAVLQFQAHEVPD